MAHRSKTQNNSHFWRYLNAFHTKIQLVAKQAHIITVFSVNSLDCTVVQSIYNTSKRLPQPPVTANRYISVYLVEAISMSSSFSVGMCVDFNCKRRLEMTMLEQISTVADVIVVVVDECLELDMKTTTKTTVYKNHKRCSDSISHHKVPR